MPSINTKNDLDYLDLGLILGGLLFVALIGAFIVSTVSGRSKDTTTDKTASASTSETGGAIYKVLSPATVVSKTAECSQPITLASDGNSGPVTCSNGDLNVTEWNTLATLEPTVMSQTYTSSEAQIQTAICNDIASTESDANTSNASAIEQTVYEISALYYGWSFSPAPSSSGC